MKISKISEKEKEYKHKTILTNRPKSRFKGMPTHCGVAPEVPVYYTHTKKNLT